MRRLDGMCQTNEQVVPRNRPLRWCPCHEMLAAHSSPRCSLPHVIIALLGSLLSLEGGFEGGLGRFVGLDRTRLRRSREY